MKTNRRFLLAAIFGFALAFTFSCTAGDDTNGGTSSPSSGGDNNKCTDAENCKKKQIGNKVWMAENLNIDLGGGSRCYEDKPENCTKYGRLYSWAAAMGIDAKYNNQSWGESDARHKGICPTGWHIPSDADWEELVSHVESENYCSRCAARYLKAKSGWNGNGNGTDAYGFSALPGGIGGNGSFYNVGDDGRWWSATEHNSGSAYSRVMGHLDDEDVFYFDYNKYYLFSVRCVQD